MRNTPPTLEDLKAMIAQVGQLPSTPLSISFSNTAERDCAIEAWQAKEREIDVNGTPSFQWRGVEIKTNANIPRDHIAVIYPDHISLINLTTGKGFKVETGINSIFNRPMKVERKPPTAIWTGWDFGS